MSHLEQSYRTAAEVMGITKDAYTRFPAHEVLTLPRYFYCQWISDKSLRETIHKHCINKDNLACFNHRVGLPTVKDDEYEGQPTELFQYQKHIMELQESSSYYAQNKCRGAGSTELKIVRKNPWKYMNITNVGRKSLIVAGINLDMALVFMNRIKLLCDKIPECYLFPPKSDYPSEIFFAQGGSIWSLPAHPNAVRSLENVGDEDYDEAAHWTRIDDTPVLKAGEPHVTKSRAHLSHMSTPAGKKKFFWDYIFDPERTPKTKYTIHTLNWRECVGIPEPDPEVLKDIDFAKEGTRETLDKLYLKRYETDKQYKQWFNTFFPGRDIKQILNVPKPILDIKEIVNLYITDRSEYDQEFDNQFILTENTAFGKEGIQIADDEQAEEFVTA